MNTKKLLIILICTAYFAHLNTHADFWARFFTKKNKPSAQTVTKMVFYRLNQDNTHRIALVKGDLLNLQPFIKDHNINTTGTYTIVNAANKVLWLGSGIAGEIKKADKSGDVQKECDTLRATYGQKKSVKKKTDFFLPTTFEESMPVGSAWLTKSGDLHNQPYNINYIIHAVGPNCDDSQEGPYFQEFLDVAYTSIFASIIKHNSTPSNKPAISTIACPSLSTSIFACNLQKSARVAANRIFLIMQRIAELNDTNGPTTFIMVAWTDTDFAAYQAAFETQYKQLPL
jgi:O-acetyl-ADP-ribose deacetylase (regulator of RNase III)